MINLNKRSKKLLLLQRNELLTSKQIYFRKKFGRYLFTNLFINFFQNKKLEESAYSLFKKEFNSIENYLPEEANNVLDIGCGLGLLNIFINQKNNNKPEFF